MTEAITNNNKDSCFANFPKINDLYILCLRYDEMDADQQYCAGDENSYKFIERKFFFHYPVLLYIYNLRPNEIPDH